VWSEGLGKKSSHGVSCLNHYSAACPRQRPIDVSNIKLLANIRSEAREANKMNKTFSRCQLGQLAKSDGHPRAYFSPSP
jgi:hypothetical protein